MYSKHRIKWSCPCKFPFSFPPVFLSLWQNFFPLVVSARAFYLSLRLVPHMRVCSENSLLLLVASRFCFFYFILEEYCRRKGKEYNSCGCEKTCDNPSGSCAGQCKEGCFCKRGKVLNTQGICEANGNCGCIYKGKKYKVSPIRFCYLPWGARMAQWEHSRPPMWPGFKSCVEVICGLSLLLDL